MKTSMLTRKSSLKVHLINTRLNVHYNSFLPSTIRLWNSLPAKLVEEIDIAKFKEKLNNFNLDFID